MLSCILGSAVFVLGTGTILSLLAFFLGYEVKKHKAAFAIVFLVFFIAV